MHTVVSHMHVLVSADFCSGGETQTPDQTLLGIMEVKGYTEDDLEYQIC